jgi:hypothetical protein
LGSAPANSDGRELDRLPARRAFAVQIDLHEYRDAQRSQIGNRLGRLFADAQPARLAP